ncbi:DUF1329 domain-containing protein [Marinobacter mobilis]
MIMNKHLLTAAILGASLNLASGQAAAAMTAEEVARLSADLTPVGAIRAGNADGSIPEWTGGLTTPPAGFDREQGYPNPFADEEPLMVITAANMDQYADRLTEGHKAMLARFPDSYRIPVYPTHRTAVIPAEEHEIIRSESPTVELAPGGNGLVNFNQTNVPFPIPKEGIEVIWNHLTRYRASGYRDYPTEAVVQGNGSFTPVVRERRLTMAAAMDDAEDNRLFYYWNKALEPTSVAGSQLLVHEPINHISEQRLAWRYNPGARRVLRAPEVGYDSPPITSDGLRTNDSTDMFNGAPDKYNWELVGKQEMLIPYNTYQLADKGLAYTDIIGAGHINQDLTRYELHRVWVVEATLKDGERHIYSKRRFYIDEDSWSIALAEDYDGRGELWRVEEAHQIHYYDQLVPAHHLEAVYDLQSNRYIAYNLQNEEPVVEFGPQGSVGDYSPAVLRRRGR